MGDRGPRPDPDQAAKGYPGKRKSKAMRAAEEAARVAALMVPVSGSAAELPGMLQDPKYAPAAAVWRRLAPELKQTHRLPKEAEFHFMQLCIYAQEWTEATDDLHTKGFVQHVQTVAGGKMERRRPKILDRQQAFQNLMELSSRFGMTPHDLYTLFKDQALAMQRSPGLFGEQPRAAQPQQDAQAEPQPTEERVSRVGSLGRHRSAPPLN